MITNRPDTCRSCKAHVPAQSLVSYRRGDGVYECPVCRPGNIRRAIEAGTRTLAIQELARLIEAAGNLKHQTALALAYGTGLRAGEVVALKVGDIELF